MNKPTVEVVSDGNFRWIKGRVKTSRISSRHESDTNSSSALISASSKRARPSGKGVQPQSTIETEFGELDVSPIPTIWANPS